MKPELKFRAHSLSFISPYFVKSTRACNVTETNTAITLNLILQINRCEIPALEMKKIFGDILKLRELDKATVTVVRN